LRPCAPAQDRSILRRVLRSILDFLVVGFQSVFAPPCPTQPFFCPCFCSAILARNFLQSLPISYIIMIISPYSFPRVLLLPITVITFPCCSFVPILFSYSRSQGIPGPRPYFSLSILILRLRLAHLAPHLPSQQKIHKINNRHDVHKQATSNMCSSVTVIHAMYTPDGPANAVSNSIQFN
jgi:hypothetical protein